MYARMYVLSFLLFYKKNKNLIHLWTATAVILKVVAIAVVLKCVKLDRKLWLKNQYKI